MYNLVTLKQTSRTFYSRKYKISVCIYSKHTVHKNINGSEKESQYYIRIIVAATVFQSHFTRNHPVTDFRRNLTRRIFSAPRLWPLAVIATKCLFIESMRHPRPFYWTDGIAFPRRFRLFHAEEISVTMGDAWQKWEKEDRERSPLALREPRKTNSAIRIRARKIWIFRFKGHKMTSRW